MAKLTNQCHHPRCNRRLGPSPFWTEAGHRFCSAECRVAHLVTRKRAEPTVSNWIGARWKAFESWVWRLQCRTLKPVNPANNK